MQSKLFRVGENCSGDISAMIYFPKMSKLYLKRSSFFFLFASQFFSVSHRLELPLPDKKRYLAMQGSIFRAPLMDDATESNTALLATVSRRNPDGRNSDSGIMKTVPTAPFLHCLACLCYIGVFARLTEPHLLTKQSHLPEVLAKNRKLCRRHGVDDGPKRLSFYS